MEGIFLPPLITYCGFFCQIDREEGEEEEEGKNSSVTS